ncbi:hypothetical protein HYH03_016515 [Edaphochlamys debaryana]|uniref:Uncharacterized protein n=1 Tax=Edaphochlamys debaryana TaxID=47281 RepID=A0A835XM09_9CHLO|nr:hypothetical protein HYH03_016515 [Edaphochlamys debaryana]|eukprot:KAG2484686.1 hypothetical protein HYH03_016515 [Edaphochlamys debaryana]
MAVLIARAAASGRGLAGCGLLAEARLAQAGCQWTAAGAGGASEGTASGTRSAPPPCADQKQQLPRDPATPAASLISSSLLVDKGRPQISTIGYPPFPAPASQQSVTSSHLPLPAALTHRTTFHHSRHVPPLLGGLRPFGASKALSTSADSSSKAPRPRDEERAQSKPATPSAAPSPGIPSVSSGSHPVYNLPNAVSVARLVSGPIIGMWLLQGHYAAATVALLVSGWSDWLDGYLARRMGATSVFGSYLDPLADKVLIGCVAAALLAHGDMPGWVAFWVVGRDVALVTGAFVYRFRSFGWRWPGREAFFRTADAPAPAASADGAAAPAAGLAEAAASGGAGDGGGVAGTRHGVAFMKPLMISKANTALQLVLLGGYLLRGMYGMPPDDVITALELTTVGTTITSGAVYWSIAHRGGLFK